MTLPSGIQIRTVHFGYAHTMPMICTPDLATKLEAELKKSNQKVVGKAVDNDDLFQLKCKDDIYNFTIKLQKIGNVVSGENEPVIGLSVLIGEDGNFNSMSQIYFNFLAQLNAAGQPILGLVVQKQATIRKRVGPFREKPALQYLWETVLNQKPDVLQKFGPAIQSGGIKIEVAPQNVPPANDHTETTPQNIEIVQARHLVDSMPNDPRYIQVQSVYNFIQPIHYPELKLMAEAAARNITYVLENAENVAAGFLNHGETK